MRFSLKTMLLPLTAAAVACFSLFYANPLLADAWYTACMAAIVVGIVGAVSRQGEKRAYWIGLSVAVAAYVWLTMGIFGASLDTYRTLESDVGLVRAYSRAAIVTSRLLIYGHQFATEVEVGSLTAAEKYRLLANMCVGHSSLALLCGWLSGHLAARLYRQC